MAKTNFTDGSFLTPTYANAIFAHVHDGVDADGHCSLIDLTTQVSGGLPLANMVKIPLSGANIGVTGYITQSQTTGMNYMDLTSAQSVTGIKGFGDELKFKSFTLNGANTDYTYQFTPVTVTAMPANSYARVWKATTPNGLNEYHIAGYVYSETSISGTYVIPLTSLGLGSTGFFHIDLAYCSSVGNYGTLKVTKILESTFTSVGGTNSSAMNGSVANGHAAIGYSSGAKLWFQESGSGNKIFRFQGVIREMTSSWD